MSSLFVGNSRVSVKVEIVLKLHECERVLDFLTTFFLFDTSVVQWACTIPFVDYIRRLPRISVRVSSSILCCNVVKYDYSLKTGFSSRSESASHPKEGSGSGEVLGV